MAHAEQWESKAEYYHPRTPEDSPLWHLLSDQFDNFLYNYSKKNSKEFGFYRPVITEVVNDYLKCGDLKEGFARVRCPDCCHEFLLAFSCRGRWFCPSCHAKKVVQFGEILRENILYPVPHRQYVFSIPIILRKFFLYNRKLLSKLCQCAQKSLLWFLRTVIGLDDGILGSVMAIQTFGDYAKWHPHIHSITADGLFRSNGVFYVMPKVSIKPLAELFRTEVLKMLKKEDLIDDKFIAMIMKWRHTSGFSVDNGVRISRDDHKGQTAVAQYILRSPFSVSKITYTSKTGMVVYKSKMTHSKIKGGKKNFGIYTAQEFIASITQHIPDKNSQLVRYVGWYSNRMRGDRKKVAQAEYEEQQQQEQSGEIEVIDVSDYKPRRIPPPTWRECIKKIWEVDPLECPKCHGEMKIISFITEKPIIRKILEHLDLWREDQRLPPNKASPDCQTNVEIEIREVVYEPFDDGWPVYEEPFVMVH